MFSIQSSEFNKILRNDFKKEALIEVALIFVYIYKFILQVHITLFTQILNEDGM